jgi:hypothetical protein
MLQTSFIAPYSGAVNVGTGCAVIFVAVNVGTGCAVIFVAVNVGTGCAVIFVVVKVRLPVSLTC